ncbi:geranylgeranyl pyrophosphate synthase [Bellilinea caldifistulae]|nr:polyprenyl synthetase family protein [Bellilinea caldifistulae]GAP10731.1 geranylgeranyl pyrophosphate synthase [Bellilinea caldifistulae]
MESQAEGHHADLQAALRHIITSGGKRIRPTVTLLVGRMLGAAQDKLITLAAAIELLHTATLVHDDLIDGALLRRGIPTLNSQWSPGATVLTGDFLFARAAKLAADTESIPVMSLFSSTLSVIVNGEISQLFSSRCQADRQGYYQRIYAKTASLFETSATCAALISPVTEETIQTIRTYGFNIGMAFQIMDDVLDFISDPSKLGKPVGSDLKQGLITLPTIYYIENHPEDEMVQQILDGHCPHYEEEIQSLVERIRNSPSIDQSIAEAERYVNEAFLCLQKLPPCPERTHLEELTLYITRREL